MQILVLKIILIRVLILELFLKLLFTLMPIPKALNTNAAASGVTAFGCDGRERERFHVSFVLAPAVAHKTLGPSHKPNKTYRLSI